MPVNPLRSICCREVGCGYEYKHKRMEGKAWKLERMIHVASGECASRVTAFQERQDEKVDARLEQVQMLQDQIDVLRLDFDTLVQRVSIRLESRKKRKDFVQRDNKPKPWPMGTCVDYLRGQGLPIADKFKEIMTVDRDPAWSWERALGAWFHWLLDQSPSDPILMLYGGEIRFWTSSYCKEKVTRLQYFRCLAQTVKNWSHLDENVEAFFVGFYFPMVQQARTLCHWNNRIMFDLPCCERAKDEFDRKVFAENPYNMEPDLQFQMRIARVFHSVLEERMEKRKESD